jgi:hypothetical protein
VVRLVHAVVVLRAGPFVRMLLFMCDVCLAPLPYTVYLRVLSSRPAAVQICTLRVLVELPGWQLKLAVAQVAAGRKQVFSVRPQIIQCTTARAHYVTRLLQTDATGKLTVLQAVQALTSVCG